MNNELEGSSLGRVTHIGGWGGGRECEGKGGWNGGRQVGVGVGYECEGKAGWDGGGKGEGRDGW